MQVEELVLDGNSDSPSTEWERRHCIGDRCRQVGDCGRSTWQLSSICVLAEKWAMGPEVGK